MTNTTARHQFPASRSVVEYTVAYPANMKIDRTAFAGSRVAYAAAIYHLERFMAELTEEIKLKEMADEEEAAR